MVEHVQQVIDILGLMGDSSDNILGIPGIGPKMAQTFIVNLLEHTGQTKRNVSKKMQTLLGLPRNLHL